MKKNLVLCLFLALALVLCGSALAATQDGFEYTVDGSKVTISKYTGSETELVIPYTLGGAPVTAIGTQAFMNNTALTRVTLPATLQRIEHQAFCQCFSLEGVVFPDGLQSIGARAFESCPLKRIELPGSVTQVMD